MGTRVVQDHRAALEAASQLMVGETGDFTYIQRQIEVVRVGWGDPQEKCQTTQWMSNWLKVDRPIIKNGDSPR